jgi:hypothetical protein
VFPIAKEKNMVAQNQDPNQAIIVLEATDHEEVAALRQELERVNPGRQPMRAKEVAVLLDQHIGHGIGTRLIDATWHSYCDWRRVAVGHDRIRIAVGQLAAGDNKRVTEANFNYDRATGVLKISTSTPGDRWFPVPIGWR